MFSYAILLMVIVLATIAVDAWDRDRMRIQFQAEREAWNKERELLLDRIQSVDYVEFKAMTKEKSKPPEKKEPKPEYL